ncbi:MAG TPA: cytochrome c oxidase assembly protein [Candidatus Saccharimonadales bacterium]|nr:cytochrome c oxidase assembly protein [Candidatus Saccharimonadales bacterium]
MARPPATALNVDPLLLGLMVLVIAAWLGVARRSEETPGPGRRSALAGAVVLLALIWVTPLATLAQHYLLAAHLVQVLTLMGPVPALLLLSLPRNAGISPRSVPLPLRLAVHPMVAIIAVNAGFIAWHVTPVYDAALAQSWLYDLMQATLLLVSLLFWWPIVTPCSPPARALNGFGKLGYIVLATIPQTLGGLIVALAGHVLYPGYGSGPQLVGLDAMTDQQVAGASIALVSKIALFAAFWVVFMNLLNSGTDGREDDGGGGGGGGGSSPRLDAPRPRPSGLPRWLDDVGDGRTTEEPAAPRPVRAPVGSGSRQG